MVKYSEQTYRFLLLSLKSELDMGDLPGDVVLFFPFPNSFFFKYPGGSSYTPSYGGGSSYTPSYGGQSSYGPSYDSHGSHGSHGSHAPHYDDDEGDAPKVITTTKTVTTSSAQDTGLDKLNSYRQPSDSLGDIKFRLGDYLKNAPGHENMKYNQKFFQGMLQS